MITLHQLVILVLLQGSCCSDQVALVELKRIHKNRITVKECNMICKRRMSPECVGLRFYTNMCLLLSEKLEKLRVYKTSCMEQPPARESVEATSKHQLSTIENKSIGLSCPHGYKGLFACGRKKRGICGASCYHISTSEENVTGARLSCGKTNGFLVSIETEEEQRHLQNMLDVAGRGHTHWTSGTDSVVEGIWKWRATDAYFYFTNWSPSEPNGGFGENNLHIVEGDRGYRWNDLAPQIKIRFICERSAISK